MQWSKDAFQISTDKNRLQPEAIQAYLTTSYWSPGITLERVQASINGSACFGLYHEDQQIGFARVISDGVTFAYLADVYVRPDYQGHGLGKWLMSCIVDQSEFKDIRKWLLRTRDAHGLYRQYGFQSLSNPEIVMELIR